MSLVKNDYSLLLPFDREAAKRGEAICLFNGEQVEFIAGPDAVGDYIVLPKNGEFGFRRACHLRMAPLAWVEGKPVYKGDVLWHITGRRVTAAHISRETYPGFVCTDGVQVHVNNVTWTLPKVKREGWVNIYPVLAPLSEIVASASCVHSSKDAADRRALQGRVTCVPIEWEEDAK